MLNKNFIFRLLLLLCIAVVFLTNDSSSRTITLPVGSFNLTERDVVYLPLLSLSFLYRRQIRSSLRGALFHKPILLIFAVYLIWLPVGIFYGNSLKYIGWHFRQVIYILIFFPLYSYLYYSSSGYAKLKKLLLRLFLLSSILAFGLLILYFGKTDVNIRMLFYWVDFATASNIPRVLVAGALYFPAIMYLSRANFWKMSSSIQVGCFSLAIIGIVLTFTRSYWFGVIISYLLVILFTAVRNASWNGFFKFLRFAVVGVCCVAIAATTIPSFYDTVVSRLLSSEDTKSGAILFRIVEANSFLNKIQKKPIVGHGVGATVVTVAADTDKHNDESLWEETAFSHNSYLIYLLNFGIVGTFIILGCLIWILYLLVKQVNRHDVSPGKYVLLAIAGSIVALMTLSLTTSQISYAGGYFEIGILLAIADYHLKKQRDLTC